MKSPSLTPYCRRIDVKATMIFLKAGDKTVCTYEGVGTLTNPVENAR